MAQKAPLGVVNNIHINKLVDGLSFLEGLICQPFFLPNLLFLQDYFCGSDVLLLLGNERG